MASGFNGLPDGHELTREFNDGATADEVCARSLRSLTVAGVRHFYISNLPLGRAALTLHRVLALARDESK